ncbi:MAG TPA: penicillin-binding protein 2 [Limnochordia bacterium]|nr:penicillin-binding protein 2 [Limnochordia bacterium]
MRQIPLARNLVRLRIALLMLGIAAVYGLVDLRFAYLQLVHGAQLAAEARSEHMRPVAVHARRGAIFDRNLHPLAISVDSPAVFAVPQEITDPQAVAAKLAAVLGRPQAELALQLQSKASTVWLANRLDAETAARVAALDLPGIGVVKQPTRYYPATDLDGQMLGIVGVDNQGLEGLEYQYDRHLRGQPGVLMAERTGDGHLMPDGARVALAPQPGDSLVLYLDQTIQFILAKALTNAVKTTKSDWGLFVAVDPNTGGILASAIYPSFNPEQWSGVPEAVRRNLIVSNQYEPGSTFKMITGSAALDTGVVKPSDIFDCPYALDIGGGVVHDWQYGGHGLQTFVQATENSCNPVFAVIGAQLLGPDRLYQYARAFGIGQRLGVDFPGEAAGILPRPANVPDEILRFANIGFGQGVAVTPLQIAMAGAAIANGGTLLRPHYVQKILGPDGQVLKQFGRDPIRRVLSPSTAHTFLHILQLVVDEGTGGLAKAKGIAIAGKTGTAEIANPDGRGYSNMRLASFLGIMPADHPQFVGLIMLYNLKVNPPYGGDWAAPVFAEIAPQVMQVLGATS